MLYMYYQLFLYVRQEKFIKYSKYIKHFFYGIIPVFDCSYGMSMVADLPEESKKGQKVKKVCKRDTGSPINLIQ